MDESDCVPRCDVPRATFPFLSPDEAVDRVGEAVDDRVAEAPQTLPTSTTTHGAFSRPRNDGDVSLDISPRDIYPYPYPAFAVSPPAKDHLLDDSLLRLTPEKSNRVDDAAADASAAAPPPTRRKLSSSSASSVWEEKENCRVDKTISEKINEVRRRATGEKNERREGNSTERHQRRIDDAPLSKKVEKLSISSSISSSRNERPKSASSSRRESDVVGQPFSSSSFASAKVLRMEDSVAAATVASASSDVRLYIHGIPGGGARNCSAPISKINKSVPKNDTRKSRFDAAGKSFSKGKFETKKTIPSTGGTNSAPAKSASSSSKVSPSTTRSKQTHTTSPTSSSASSTLVAATSSRLPSARPELNSILRLGAASSARMTECAERSFDSTVAAEDLMREDVLIRETLRLKAATKTNVPKEEKIFDNLVPLPDRDDVDQRWEEASRKVERRKNASTSSGRRGGGGGGGESGSSRLGRGWSPNREVALSDRTEPDIRDFWNPEWEIGRPDWSMPFDPDDVLAEELNTRIVERALDFSDVIATIERRMDRWRDTNVNSMFYIS